MSYLKLEQINYSVGRNRILKNVHLEIDRGEIFSILGPSGAGKSTVLRIIIGGPLFRKRKDQPGE